MLDISVIVVSWNAKEFVRQCLTSIAEACQGLATEVLVVDNASSDGTPEMIVQEFPDVTLVQSQSNLGFAKANNIAMRRALGRYLCLINSDVTVPPGCVRTMFEYMEQNPSVGILGPKMLTPSGAPGSSCMRRPSLSIWLAHAIGLSAVCKGLALHLDNCGHSTSQDVAVLNGWFWMVRKEALAEVGLLDEQFFMYGEDIDWCHRFWDNGWRVVYLPQAAATHYGGASSNRAPIRFYIEMQRARLQYWNFHHGYVSRCLYIGILVLHHILRVLGYAAVYALKRSCRLDTWFKVRRSATCLLWLAGIDKSVEMHAN